VKIDKIYLSLIVPLALPSVLFSASDRLDMLDDIFSLDLESLQNISVASVSKMEQPLKDVPANMVIFTQEKIEKRGFRNVADLLETLPGVTIHNFSTSGYFNSTILILDLTTLLGQVDKKSY